TTALLDSGAFSCYIDQRFTEKHGFKIIPLNHEIRILNADASPNKGGAITHRVVTSILIGGHRSTESLLVTNLGRMSMILGMKFIQEH
ncbi:uncharacterized protein LAESUDRAFT_772260, partial [Laetiporus sulphureus 93-53]